MGAYLSKQEYSNQISRQTARLNLLKDDIDINSSWQLYRKLCERWSEKKHLFFSDFIQCALYDLEYGYYSAGVTPIGKDSDFVTAPELSEVFSIAIAEYVRPYLKTYSGVMVELGAGNGTLAKQLITSLESDLSRYYIVEISPALKHKQQTLLKNSGADLTKVIWLDGLHQIPEQSFIIGNEVLDAIPASFFRHDNGYFSEACWDPFSPFEILWSEKISTELQLWLKQHWKKLQSLDVASDPTFVFEAGMHRTHYICSGLRHLTEAVLVLFDYGYGAKEFFHPQRSGGTLNAFIKHHQHRNIAWLPGQQDITSHVNFSELCGALENDRWYLQGFCSQSKFIIESQILHNMQLSKNLVERLEQSRSMQKLMLPSEMGETIKAIAFSRNIMENAPTLIPSQLVNRL